MCRELRMESCIVCIVSSDFSSAKIGYSNWKICKSCYSKTFALMDGFSNEYPKQPISPQICITAGHLRLIKRLKESSDMVDFLRQIYPTDIQLLPDPEKGGFPIPAHTKFLAARSSVFKNMLDEDGIMEVSGNGSIVLPELSHEELACFSEFLYKGELSCPDLDKHFKALFIAAHKYDVPSLTEALLEQLNAQNALHILEVSVSHTDSLMKPKEIALNFIVQDIDKIVFTPEYADFTTRYPNLSLEIQRAASKKRRYMH